MGKDASLKIPGFKKFTEACVYAHPWWDMLAHNAAELKTTLRIGSRGNWQNFIRAPIHWWHVRRSVETMRNV